MAINFQKSLLDQLMGVDRNSAYKEEITWDNQRVCKYYLAGFCPHELFVNTRLSLGPCEKIHETNLLLKYQKSSSYLNVGYELKLKKLLEDFVREVKTKIKHNEEKLIGSGKSKIELKLESNLVEQQLEIDEIVKNLEMLGNEGRIEECSIIYDQLEEKQKQYNYNKVELERLRMDSAFTKDEVCQICGAFTSKIDLNIIDENHITGKTHSGYVKINEVLEKLSSLIPQEKSDHSDYSQEDDNRSKRSRSSTRSSRYRDSNRRRNDYKPYKRSRSRDKNHERDRKSGRNYDRARNRSKETYRKY